MSAASFDSRSCAGCDSQSLKSELREARSLIVQLQRELERARGVIGEQQSIVRLALVARNERRGR